MSNHNISRPEGRDLVTTYYGASHDELIRLAHKWTVEHGHRHRIKAVRGESAAFRLTCVDALKDSRFRPAETAP